MGKKLKGLRHLWSVTALAAVLAVAGCSGDSPLAPDTEQHPGLGRTVMRSMEESVPEASVTEVSQTIVASEGGVIPIAKDDYEHTFTVVEDGVDEDVTIDIRAEEKLVNGKNSVVFEFGPNGLVFREAAILEFRMADINEQAEIANLYYYDPKAADWILQAEKEVVEGSVIFEIYHFSKYAISD